MFYKRENRPISCKYDKLLPLDDYRRESPLGSLICLVKCLIVDVLLAVWNKNLNFKDGRFLGACIIRCISVYWILDDQTQVDSKPVGQP